MLKGEGFSVLTEGKGDAAGEKQGKKCEGELHFFDVFALTGGLTMRVYLLVEVGKLRLRGYS